MLPIIPVLAVALGAVIFSSGKTIWVPVANRKHAYWGKAFPYKPVDDTDLSPKYWDEYFVSASAIQKGDRITVGVAPGKNTNSGVVPDGKVGTGWHWIEDLLPAEYVVVEGPKDWAVENGRRLILRAHLILGAGPQTWSIYDRKNKRDKSPPAFSSFASRALTRTNRPQYESNYSLEGELFLPEVFRIQREGAGKIFQTSHFDHIGQNIK